MYIDFRYGTQDEFDALSTKNPSAVYFIEDTRRLYKGDVLIADASSFKLDPDGGLTLNGELLAIKPVESHASQATYPDVFGTNYLTVTRAVKLRDGSLTTEDQPLVQDIEAESLEVGRYEVPSVAAVKQAINDVAAHTWRSF